jgi:hypothetical protein
MHVAVAHQVEHCIDAFARERLREHLVDRQIAHGIATFHHGATGGAAGWNGGMHIIASGSIGSTGFHAFSPWGCGARASVIILARRMSSELCQMSPRAREGAERRLALDACASVIRASDGGPRRRGVLRPFERSPLGAPRRRFSAFGPWPSRDLASRSRISRGDPPRAPLVVTAVFRSPPGLLARQRAGRRSRPAHAMPRDEHPLADGTPRR